MGGEEGKNQVSPTNPGKKLQNKTEKHKLEPKSSTRREVLLQYRECPLGETGNKAETAVSGWTKMHHLLCLYMFKKRCTHLNDLFAPSQLDAGQK